MTTVIFDKNLGLHDINHAYGTDLALFLDINGGPYRITNCIDDDVDFVLANGNNQDIEQLKDIRRLRFEIYHHYENQISNLVQLLEQRKNLIIISDAYNANIQHDRLVYADFAFNITKAYYGQYPFRIGTHYWISRGQLSYIKCDLVNASKKNKIFIGLNKTHNNTRKYRRRLVEVLNDYQSVGYATNADDSSTFLQPHVEFVLETDINVLEQQTSRPTYQFNYTPPHNSYYQNTFISIYVEAIEYGNSITITEKTYDPLIKGHFILPFSCAGFIDTLRLKGVRFPDFIDYSYDSVNDDELRFNAYQQEVRRLLNFSLDQWRQLYTDNIELLYSNQLYFVNRPYDRINFTELLDK